MGGRGRRMSSNFHLVSANIICLGQHLRIFRAEQGGICYYIRGWGIKLIVNMDVNSGHYYRESALFCIFKK